MGYDLGTRASRGRIGSGGYICTPGSQFLLDASGSGITAHAGGGQSNATPITSQLCAVTTVASAGDSVLLPSTSKILPNNVPNVSASFTVVNQGASPMTVYAATGDTINGGSSVSQTPNSVVEYIAVTTGAWQTQGLGNGYSASFGTLSYSPSITAHAGGGQSNAVALTSMVNRLSTVATQGDSVALPASAPGLQITILNRGTNPAQVYGTGTDTINGIAAATGIALGINTAAIFTCNVAGNWEVPIGQLQSSTPQAISASGAIPPHVGHTYAVTKAGVAAMTLAAPTAGTDDGIEITITSNTAYAHTLTATGLLQTGTASVNAATFAAHPGASLTLLAYQGKWNVVAFIGVTFS